MYVGGVRVVVIDNDKVLLVKQRHEGRDIWMLPGGAIEEDETSIHAAKREVLEETGLNIEVRELLWFVEELREKKISDGEKSKEQRFVNFFRGEIIAGDMQLGEDPELGKDEQVLEEVSFFSKEEIMCKDKLENIYPEWLREELWEVINDERKFNPYKERK